MAILDDMKLALRISSDAFDDEIQDLMDEALADLENGGILLTKLVTTDPLIKRAVKTYVKANFGFDNPDAERLMESYKSLKIHLCLSVEYTEAVV